MKRQNYFKAIIGTLSAAFVLAVAPAGAVESSPLVFDVNTAAPRCNALQHTLENRFGYPVLHNNGCGELDKLAGIGIKGQKTGKGGASEPIVIDGIDFGDDTSAWANDGECDDLRFVGENMAVELVPEDEGHDATDCSVLYQDGLIGLKPSPADLVDAIDFGDNSSQWANDGECDDPRFDGPKSAERLLDEDMGHDANDCRSLFLSGDVEFLGADPNMDIIEYDGIVFGDNLSEWASDGECDDPRFTGEGVAETLVEEDRGRDAVDCLALYQSGMIELASNVSTAPMDIDFGDDSSDWSNDGECDDPRFQGDGVAAVLLPEDEGRDASDCENLFASGAITLISGATPTNAQDIDFGDDTSSWANDGECDDPRFAGEGVASTLLDEDMARDATDCRTLYQSGDIYLAGSAGSDANTVIDGINFGDDSSTWANDGECDDPRFNGEGTADILLEEDTFRDATDCREAFDAGTIILANGDNTGSVLIVDGIDFGDNSSSWANDGECDDPRFQGEGVAGTLLDEDMGRDATDCMTLYQAGQITLASEPSIESQGIEFGDDTSEWANDGECDDSRFEGEGAFDSGTDDYIGHDATDCSSNFADGMITLKDGASPELLEQEQVQVSTTGIEFGDDTSDWAQDGECDDSRFEGEGAFDAGTDDYVGRDATDCSTNFADGMITLKDGASPTLGEVMGGDANESSNNTEPMNADSGHPSGIDFGENNALWANDGECDDPRFMGSGMASMPDDVYMFQDAADCIAAFDAGTIMAK